MTTTTASIIDRLAALSTADVTVTAAVRESRIVASYHVAPVDPADADQVEAWGEQTSREIGKIMRDAGYTFGDAGGDSPGIYEVWKAPTMRGAAEERTYIVEGCGADRTLTATSAEAAAQEAAEWQYGVDGARAVTLTWVGTGPDGGSVAEYRAEWVETIGAESVTQSARIVVREVD